MDMSGLQILAATVPSSHSSAIAWRKRWTHCIHWKCQELINQQHAPHLGRFIFSPALPAECHTSHVRLYLDILQKNETRDDDNDDDCRNENNQNHDFYVLLTVHFSNILFRVSNLMHLFIISLYIPLHVSSHTVLIIRRFYCIYTASGYLCITLLGWLSPKKSDT